jgi:hypothetical protein
MNPIRTTAKTTLRLVRLPADVAISLVGRRSSAGQAAQVVVDRADAVAREAVGRITGDDALRAEARRGREAASTRETAVDLREEAQARREHADTKRERAEKTADQQKAGAERRAKTRKTQARKQAASERQEQREREERDKLASLERKREALQEREGALEAADEAQRLEAAASGVKAARKNGS